MVLVNNFVVLDSIYGKFLINRHCDYQSETILKTGKTHIESELATIFNVVDRLPDNAIIIDGGANAGFFTVPVAQRIKSRGGLVISFEPQREIFNGLAGTIVLNDLDNVRLNRLGLGETTSNAKLPDIDYSKNQDFGTVALSQTDFTSNLYDILVDQKTVQVIAIDEILLPRLDFLKLDVEGYELNVLRGAKETLIKFRPFIWIEYWKLGAQAIVDELNYLYNYQYEIKDPLNMLFSPMEKL